MHWGFAPIVSKFQEVVLGPNYFQKIAVLKELDYFWSFSIQFHKICLKFIYLVKKVKFRKNWNKLMYCIFFGSSLTVIMCEELCNTFCYFFSIGLENWNLVFFSWLLQRMRKNLKKSRFKLDFRNHWKMIEHKPNICMHYWQSH